MCIFDDSPWDCLLHRCQKENGSCGALRQQIKCDCRHHYSPHHWRKTLWQQWGQQHQTHCTSCWVPDGPGNLSVQSDVLIYNSTYQMIHSTECSNCVFNVLCCSCNIGSIPYFLQNSNQFVQRDRPRIVITPCEVSEHWNEDTSPCIVECSTRREVLNAVLVADTTPWTVRGPSLFAWGG